MDYDQHRILHHLDDPMRLLKWTLDEAAVILIPPFFGLAVGHLIPGMVFSAIGFWGITGVKKRVGFVSLKHALYWYFPHNNRALPNTPPSHIREYFG